MLPDKSFTTEEILRGDFVAWGLACRDLLPDYANKSAASNYRRGLRAAVRAFWRGVYPLADFMTTMGTAIDIAFRRTWSEGMASCGLTTDEMTVEERQHLTILINEELRYISRFALDISNNSRANGGKLGPLLARVDLWLNRLKYVRAQAKTMACADLKGIWNLGQTEQHCQDCGEKYAGRVYRMSIWRKYLAPVDALPQGRGLACKGYQCDCEIAVTDQRATPGRPPMPVGRAA